MLRVTYRAAGDGCEGKEQPPKEADDTCQKLSGVVQKMCGTVTGLWSAITEYIRMKIQGSRVSFFYDGRLTRFFITEIPLGSLWSGKKGQRNGY